VRGSARRHYEARRQRVDHVCSERTTSPCCSIARLMAARHPGLTEMMTDWVGAPVANAREARDRTLSRIGSRAGARSRPRQSRVREGRGSHGASSAIHRPRSAVGS